MSVSVIIPTYNRKESLLDTLTSLEQQTFPSWLFEVVVVDDGSTDGTGAIAQHTFSFHLEYLRQGNHGGISARNHGAEHARNDLLIFLDDDMTLMPGYVAAIAQAHQETSRLVSRGALQPWLSNVSPFARIHSQADDEKSSSIGNFASNNLAIARADFFTIDKWHQVTNDRCQHKGGLWADLEFAHRALQAGFELRTIPEAQIVHRDYAIKDLQTAAERGYLISTCAAFVFQEHPDLWPYVPMLHDKHPIAWRHDPARLITRKLMRQITATRPVLWSMQLFTSFLESVFPHPSLLRVLYRWVIGEYIHRGYRQGMKSLRDHNVIARQP